MYRIHPDIWRGMVKAGATESIQNLLEDGAAGKITSAYQLIAYQSFTRLLGSSHRQNGEALHPHAIWCAWTDWAAEFIRR